MPELPEVQITVNGLNNYLKGLKITAVWTNYNSAYHIGKDNIKNPKYFEYFKKEIVGKKIIGARRVAKNVIITLSNGSTILIHMKMTGHLLYGNYVFEKSDKKDPWKGVSPKALTDSFNRHIRLVFSLSNKKYLALSDVRRFAKITHIREKDIEKTTHLEKLGPEPLAENFTNEKFLSRLTLRPNMKIKQALIEQSLISGIGNIYSDELLWRADVLPTRKVKSIRPAEFKKMYKAMKTVLKAGIDFGGDSMSDYRNLLGERGCFQEKHRAYRKTGEKCSKKGCNGIILRTIIGARSTHFCNKHQK
ncbi:MAG TPA: bifunctional DNA-formamidopyrimidine glycosylase/DNA-(apurinic or apyrimidinic site) lyase [Candidatus Paceibacterota bacterium]